MNHQTQWILKKPKIEGLSNDSSGNIIVLYKLKKIGSPIQRIFLSVLGWESLF